MVTNDGFIIPIHIKQGLTYTTIQNPTDFELEQLPRIHLTSNEDQNPTVLDHTHDKDNWFDAMENLPNLNCDHPFDTDGNHISTNIVGIHEDDTSVLAVHLAKWETLHPDEFLSDTQAVSMIANPTILHPSPQNIA